MTEAEQTTNPVRLLVLAMDIRKALDKALAAEPNNVEVRLDLMRFHAVTPRIAGGDEAESRRQAAEIARLDPAAGHFAHGYLAYREKEYGTARKELREAVSGASNPTTKALAAKWLGWLSQETQQWNEAFVMFESLRGADPTALYEIGRTAAFCGCELERGKAALEEYIRLKPKKGMPTVEQARYQLKVIFGVRRR
jgi:tetratricopeptide (TPR) repeat protein